MQKFGFIISVLTLLLSCACMVHAQAAPDDVRTFYAADSTYILYKTGVSTVDTTFNYNGESLGRFISSIHMTEANGSKVYVEINSGASPDGNPGDNKLLSDRRTEALASYIIRHAGLSEKQIRKHSEGVAWKDLHKAVNNDNSTPPQRSSPHSAGHDRRPQQKAEVPAFGRSLRLYAGQHIPAPAVQHLDPVLQP